MPLACSSLTDSIRNVRACLWPIEQCSDDSPEVLVYHLRTYKDCRGGVSTLPHAEYHDIQLSFPNSVFKIKSVIISFT